MVMDPFAICCAGAVCVVRFSRQFATSPKRMRANRTYNSVSMRTDDDHVAGGFLCFYLPQILGTRVDHATRSILSPTSMHTHIGRRNANGNTPHRSINSNSKEPETAGWNGGCCCWCVGATEGRSQLASNYFSNFPDDATDRRARPAHIYLPASWPSSRSVRLYAFFLLRPSAWSWSAFTFRFCAAMFRDCFGVYHIIIYVAGVGPTRN